MFNISVKINAKDKENMIKYLKSIIASVSYIKYSEEDSILTLNGNEDYDNIVNDLSSYGTIITSKCDTVKKTEEKYSIDSFIDELISQSSDINKLAANIYKELGITVRRSCDKRFASMISSFIESGEPVCMSTIEETEFSPNNFKTLAKACADKGVEPFEFIGRVCEKYSAINKDIGDIESVPQPIQSVPQPIQEESREIKPISVEESQPIKPDDTVKDTQSEIPAELEPITIEPVQQTDPDKVVPVIIEPKEEEPESDIVENTVKPVAIKSTLKSLPKSPKAVSTGTVKRKYTPRRTNPNDLDDLPAREKMNRIRNNYKLAFENKAFKKQVITLQSALDYLSTDALEILFISVSEEPDIDKGKELIEAEARRKERGNIGYEIRQVYARLRKIFEAKSKDYPVKDPVKTLHYFQQLCANQDTSALMRMIAHNLVAQDRVDDAISFCNEVDGKKNRTNVYTQQNRQTDSLIKELNSVPIARMILEQVEGGSVYSDTDFITTLEKTMDRNNIKPGQIWLGRDETGQVDILLSDVWYDKNLSITSFLQGMLKQ